ncbi:hypothetical protein [Phenylobacterium sp. J367]|uniref:hypothetical protein n=1 Tax=Phenylobacterium sp. J367 TaxID=2898435 RepID=UPI0021519DD4|nr:hypothetical protein [Phenylobacterium sp. J367]MCR5877512.1 hypothetical protein [Phenylobacterium sp. J367]
MLIAALTLALAAPPLTVSKPMTVRVRVEAVCMVAAHAASACRGATGAAPLVDRETNADGQRRRIVEY